MASYVDSTLLPNETLLYRAHVSLWSSFSLLLMGVLLLAVGLGLSYFFLTNIKDSTTEQIASLVAVVIGLSFFLSAYIQYTTTEFAVTDKRIIAKTGLVSRKTVELFLDKVESLNVTQTVRGRILGYGTIDIRGTGSTDETIQNISSPLELRKQFMAAADKYRQKVV